MAQSRIMHELVRFRAYCRTMARREERPSLAAAGDDANTQVRAEERRRDAALWRMLADEIDTYLDAAAEGIDDAPTLELCWRRSRGRPDPGTGGASRPPPP